jgi:hypothetical protein
MKPSRSLPTIMSLLLLTVVGAYSQQIIVQENSSDPVILSAADIGSLPHTTVKVSGPDGTKVFSGVLVATVLKKANVGSGQALKGKRLASCLIVEAADGYRVVIALPELDPKFTDKQILLADERDGKPLDDKEGPYRIIIPDEKRMARWVRQVKTLKIVDVQ